jgi:hypothetical protein
MIPTRLAAVARRWSIALSAPLLAVLFGGWASPSLEHADVPLDPGTPERISVTPSNPRPGDHVRLTYENPAVAGRAVFVHFGANGWNLRLPGPGAGQEIEQANLSYFRHEPMTYDAATHRYAFELDLPRDARALHFAFCWDGCNSGEWDNNNKRDYAWPVTFPYIGPVLTWNQATAPESGVVVQFENTWVAPGWVEFGPVGGATRRVASVAGLRHRFALTGLTPDTTYEYRVGVGLAVSERYRFKTAKRPDDLQRLSFAVFGDAQDNGEDGRFAKLTAELASRQADVDFVLSTGDLPWNDHPGDWWTFFDKARPLFATHVVMPVVGNHDTPSVDSDSNHRSWLRYFALPETDADQGYFTFKYGKAAFYGMNSERPRELAPGGRQYEWLVDRLRERDGEVSGPTSWTFAYWHIPPFNAGARHWQQQYDKRDAAALFEGLVDWHFGGHEHLYQRFQPLVDVAGAARPVARYGTAAGQGVGFLVVPASGVAGGTALARGATHPELRERLAYPRLAAGTDEVASPIGYTRVDLDGSRITLRVFMLPESGNGAAVVVDQVQYDKAAR